MNRPPLEKCSFFRCGLCKTGICVELRVRARVRVRVRARVKTRIQTRDSVGKPPNW